MRPRCACPGQKSMLLSSSKARKGKRRHPSWEWEHLGEAKGLTRHPIRVRVRVGVRVRVRVRA